MKDERKTKEQLINESVELRQRVAELEASEAERVQAEEELQESEEKYRTLVEHSLQGLVVIQDFGIVFANAAFAEISGYTVEELLSLSPEGVRAMIHPEDQALVWGRFRDRLTGEPVPPRYEYRGIRKDGSVRWLEMFASRIEYHGKPAVQGAIIDITERKRAEETLRESEEKFRSVIEQSEDGICITDEEGYTIVWNRSLEQITGLKTEEMVGRTIWDAQFQMNPADQKTPEAYERLKTALHEFLETGRATWAGQLLEREYVQPDGTRLFVQGVTFPIKTHKGFMLGSITRDITERKRAEEQLRILSSVVEQSASSIAILDKEGIVEYVNPKLLELYEISLEEVVGKNWRSWLSMYSTLKEKLPEMRNTVLERGTTWKGEVTDRSKRGEVVWRAVTIFPAKDANGEIAHIVYVSEDITERKWAERALGKAEEEKETILDSLVEHVLYEDMEMKILWANRAACESASLSREELIGCYCYEIWPKRSEPCPDCPVVKAIETGQRQEVEKTTRDGRAWFIRGYPVQDEKGDIVGGVELTLEITERKRMESLLQALNEAAWAMERALTLEEIFAAVAEEFKKLGLSCMVFPTDESQSRLFTKYLSYETNALQAVEKLVGLQHEDFTIPIETVDPYRRVVQGKRTVFIENAEDIVRQVLPESLGRLAGQIVKRLKVPRSIAAPLLVENEVIGVFSVQSDDLTADDVPAITAFAHQMAAAWHKTQLIQDLQNSLEELKRTQAQLIQAQKMEAFGQLAAGIAHDFNNLLTSIGGFSELLLREAPEGSQQQEDLRQIKIAAQRAADLTRQLRLFTRQEEGKRFPIRLNSAVEEIHALLERSLPKEITVELHLEPGLWAAEADPSQMSQVLMNLCVNARDAMPDGGTLTLETRNMTLDEEEARAILSAQPGRYVRLSVSDTGCGMSSKVQTRLFEPFFTTKEAGKGTGLGLAVVYGIVKAHGGFINVYSEVDQGSTFHLYLPAIRLAVEERETKAAELPTGTETILLVDDEESVRKLGQRILKRCSYTVLMAENGVQALEVYQAHQGEIALVVLDALMPEMGGRECLRRLRELDPQVKVLISTGYTADSSAQELMAEGALGIVEKPFLLQDFATAVRTVLDRDSKPLENP
jgi:PAS domain S-box-containing protein